MGMTGYSLEWLEWMEIADMAINNCKWLKIALNFWE